MLTNDPGLQGGMTCNPNKSFILHLTASSPPKRSVFLCTFRGLYCFLPDFSFLAL
jgi:hypothetical protein